MSATLLRPKAYSLRQSVNSLGRVQPNHTPIFAPALRWSAASGVSRTFSIPVACIVISGISVAKRWDQVPATSHPDGILRLVMDATSPLSAASEGLIHITIPVGLLHCNCSIIGDPVTREALVVDPGDEVGRILALLGRHKLKVQAIVSTHAHIDHVGGLSKLHQYTGAPVLMHRDDLPLYHGMEVQAAFLGVQTPELTNVDQLLKEGDTLRWG